MPVTTGSSSSRRRFLQLAGFSALSLPLKGQKVAGANNTVRLGLIGCGGRGNSLAGEFAKLADTAIVALSDADTAHMEQLAGRLGKNGRRPELFQDYRKLLERKDIDAVIVASPNYWHTLHAIQSMHAGKDVYLEKPVTYDLWEGRQLVAAEKRYGRIIAAGLQNRSDPGARAGIQFVREGGLGKILEVHVCCFRNRGSIGRSKEPLKPPPTVDYNLWLGPAADLPILRKQFHYDWHWVWNTGNGDIGNQTPHEIDLANWVLGDRTLPATVRSFGNRFGWDDAGETPNLQSAWYEVDGIRCRIEVNNMRLAPERNVPGMRDTVRVGLVVRCEGGQLRGGRGGTYAVAPDGKTRLQKFPGDAGAGHQRNFVDAVRSRRREDVAAKLVDSERSAAIAHLANLSFRSGAPADAEALDSSFGDNEILRRIVHDQAAQLADWGIADPRYQLGREISLDPATGVPDTPGIDPQLVRRACRAGFEIPELT